MYGCACPNRWQWCDHFSSSFLRASAKAAPLNINKVSNSLLNFGRKLIAPAMASGGAVGTPAGGSSFPPSSVPTRSTVEAPQPQQHHQQQHHHQSQQQRMMKSESMPVQLGKGKGERCGSAVTEGSFVVHLQGWRKVFLLLIFLSACTYLEETAKKSILLGRMPMPSTTAHLQCNTELDVISRIYKYCKKFWTFRNVLTRNCIRQTNKLHHYHKHEPSNFSCF